MVKPPGQALSRRILKIDDSVFIAIKELEIKQVSRPVQQAGVAYFRFGLNTFLVKTREGCRRSDSIKTVAVIEQTKFHNKKLRGRRRLEIGSLLRSHHNESETRMSS